MPTVLPGAYHSPYDRMIAELMMRKGDIQARRAEQQGQIWGRAAENLGQIGALYVQQRQENQQQKARVAALDQFVDSGIWAKDPQAGLAMSVKILGPVEGVKFFGGLQGASKMMGAQNPEEARKALPMVAGGLIAAPEALRPKLYGHAREMLINSGIAGPDSLPEQWTPELEPYVRSLAGEKADETVVATGPIVNKRTGQVIYEPPAKPPAVTPGSVGDWLQSDPARRKEIEAAAKAMGEARHVSVSVGGGNDNVKDAVSAMKDGTAPPLLPGRASKEYVAMIAEAKRQGYDLASAATDWNATQKHIATLNGSQQTRLRQAVDTAYHSLDVIEDLANQWQGGGFPLLNKAKLAAAKNGALGPKAQAIATQLEAQISDVTSELGNVYMGGNSPTDHALGLAAKNLSADWSLPQLKAALDLSRKNLTIRRNSMVNAGVAGASADNPYAPQQERAAAGAPQTRVLNGVTYVKVPGGWKRQ